MDRLISFIMCTVPSASAYRPGPRNRRAMMRQVRVPAARPGPPGGTPGLCPGVSGPHIVECDAAPSH
eukprot:760421-Hanusia_phi.AAC.1